MKPHRPIEHFQWITEDPRNDTDAIILKEKKHHRRNCLSRKENNVLVSLLTRTIVEEGKILPKNRKKCGRPFPFLFDERISVETSLSVAEEFWFPTIFSRFLDDIFGVEMEGGGQAFPFQVATHFFAIFSLRLVPFLFGNGAGPTELYADFHPW